MEVTENTRIMIVSDTHRAHGNLKRALEAEGHIDLLIHLGDSEGKAGEILDMIDCPLEIVAGNCDSAFSDLAREKEIRIGNYNVLLTHGHMYRVSLSLEYILQDARGMGMDIVMFGHTHRPVVENRNGVIAVNPGSISYPRQQDRRPSYMMMEFDRLGDPFFTIKYIDV